MEVPQKLKIELPYDPAIALLGIYPKDTNVMIQMGTCTLMFIVTTSTITKLWKEPRCPSTDECIKKMWYIGVYIYVCVCVCVCVCVYIYIYPSIHTMDYYSALKKKSNLAICNDVDGTRGYYAK